LCELFCPLSQRVQINYIFSDNVRMLCLSCNVKKLKANCQKIAETIVVLIVYNGVFFDVRVYIAQIEPLHLHDKKFKNHQLIFFTLIKIKDK
jgi:hypothetical protein